VEIREGVRRIGKVVGEQMELYGALTGEHPHVPAGEVVEEPDSTVVPLRKRVEGGK
jgi:hypothetical protein